MKINRIKKSNIALYSGAIVSICTSCVCLAKYIDTKLNIKYHFDSYDTDFSYDKKLDNVDNKEITDIEHKAIYNRFISVISSIPGFNTDIFFNNFNNNLTIKNYIEEENKIKLHKKIVFVEKQLAKYDSENNTIQADLESKDEAHWHELFHVASVIDTDNFIAGGFNYIDTYNDIGIGLTEGYTQLLTDRYFKEINAYMLEKRYISFIERIIGQKKMAELYSTANLEGLVIELEHFFDRKEIINFIKNVDFTFFNYKSKNPIILKQCRKSFIECNDFLYKLFVKDSINKVKNNEMSLEESSNGLNKFLEELFDIKKIAFILSSIKFNNIENLLSVNENDNDELYKDCNYVLQFTINNK